ncbi:hypothetical protein D917_05515 [Trichinella nativa]|uniref:Uncharacterized protein n=1 Tax=Trichinella nativa TaxID=6335 RepID=A0A1Y3EZV2_9BILA|nr:hypothetical protein D917_05515 [Trichinella nativa]
MRSRGLDILTGPPLHRFYRKKHVCTCSSTWGYVELLTNQHLLHNQFGSPDTASSRRSADPLLRACSSEVVIYRIYQASLASKLSHFLDVQLNRLVAATLAQTTLSATGCFSGRIIKGQRSQTAH